MCMVTDASFVLSLTMVLGELSAPQKLVVQKSFCMRRGVPKPFLMSMARVCVHVCGDGGTGSSGSML